MTPSDLAALRALAEKVDQLKRAYAVGNYSFLASELFQYLPAAQRALEWVETELLGLQGAYTMAADDNGKLRARLTRLEAALLAWRIRLAFVGHPEEPRSHGIPDWSAVVLQSDAALKGQPIQDGVERQRVHGVHETPFQKATRDAAYWRKRAESAEALAAGQETRITRLEEQLASEWVRYGQVKTIEEAMSIVQTAALEGRDE